MTGKGTGLRTLGVAALAFVAVAGFLWAHVGAGITVDREGRVHFLDTSRNTVWRVESGGRLTAIAREVHGDGLRVLADGAPEYPPDDPAVLSSVAGPDGSAYRINGNRILRVSATGSVAAIAGDTLPGYVDGAGPAARFSRPLRLSLDSAGNVYVADYGNHRIRKIAPDGAVSTVALISWPWWPTGVAVWRDRVYVLERWGDYYRLPPVSGAIADLVGHPRVRVLTAGGASEIVASVVGWRTRAIVGMIVAGLIALVVWRIRRALSRLRAG